MGEKITVSEKAAHELVWFQSEEPVEGLKFLEIEEGEKKGDLSFLSSLFGETNDNPRIDRLVVTDVADGKLYAADFNPAYSNRNAFANFATLNRKVTFVEVEKFSVTLPNGRVVTGFVDVK